MLPVEPCYLVEWYHPKFFGSTLAEAAAMLGAAAESVSTDGVSVRVATVISVPKDEVAFGVFVADSADMVTRTCDQAGFPAQRLSVASDIEFPG
ncbi:MULTISPECIES: hypothetical protein [unclassified Mycobacterium]|uniref:hypothetical protein n=1 Tax=unclassified Mycobacterium TaxID=2642494 RepID=UPI00048B00DA|nr:MULTISPECIES: hypothetical protein [unclassified Mycobacterium]